MDEVEAYVAGLEEADASALRHVVDLAREVAPTAVEGRSYGIPVLKLDGRPLVGVLAAKGHLSLFPFSPEAISAVADRLTGWSRSTGTVRFSAQAPLPDDVVRDLVAARADEIAREPAR
ncbi:iron chaperone [Lapillicoccus jejuensis]|uniref:Uncharacterized protein YdhG (YjbR/CyaY superfamily) n=1 Tax=Lapillicoccus jejuensis TaxID=402171 RepID=A0A542E4C1_9MICO|nr:DUF1801 domain-containing protein [Lapillicoccus jejuensis]TQJ10190.1 uncharacterized protein YdhG (YjbR/CyaY superfamily) [Lapillicoccus jejuensis]